MLLMLLMLTAMPLLDGLWGGQNAITAVDFNHTGDVFAYSIGYDWSVPHALAYVVPHALAYVLCPMSTASLSCRCWGHYLHSALNFISSLTNLIPSLTP